MEWPRGRTPRHLWTTLIATAAVVHAVLILDAAGRSSATYDEPTYIGIACNWWRTGNSEQITRMGSPQGFWRIQQAPSLWVLDRLGQHAWIDQPRVFEPEILTALRRGAAWISVLALVLTAIWARTLYGPQAGAMAAWIFALSPNLIAHGTLLTMEMPLIASVAGFGLVWTRFLADERLGRLVLSGGIAGLAFSCKFTAVLIPPMAALTWFLKASAAEKALKSVGRIAVGMAILLGLMLAVDFAVGGFLVLRPSERTGTHPSLTWEIMLRLAERPFPADWIGFLIQMRHQRSGGPSYLLGERRMTGWWYYYPLALAMKAAPPFWVLLVLRACKVARRDLVLPICMLTVLGLTMLGSSRNYGVRYLLPLAPLAIVWISGLVHSGRWIQRAGWASVLGLGLSVASSHPHELSYFPAYCGGTAGGRGLLADSNLDWGQGLRSLSRLQRDRPELRDLTLYDFGDSRPEVYGIVGQIYVVDASDRHPLMPERFRVETRYVAVSASLVYGPWGPPDYFQSVKRWKPVVTTDDGTILIYIMPDRVLP